MRFFLKSERSQKVELLRMLILLVKFSILVNCIPLKYYFIRYFGNKCAKQQVDLQPYRKEMGRIIQIGIQLPWQVTCLIESLAIKEYLSAYGVYLYIRLGVIKSREIQAHAWYLPQGRNNYNEIDC